MNKLFQVFCISIILSILSGCDGDDTQQDSIGNYHLPLDVTTPEAYTGNKAPALLTTQNALDFADKLFSLNTFEDYHSHLQQRQKKSRQKNRTQGLLDILTFIDQFSSELQKPQGYQARITNRFCNNADGTLQLDESQVDRQLPDRYVYEFNNCQMFGNSLPATGKIIFVIEVENATFSSRRIDFDQLQIMNGPTGFLYSGSQRYEHYSHGMEENNFKHTITSNFSERDLTSNQVGLVKDLKRIQDSDGSTITGYFFDHDHGYVTLSSSRDLSVPLYNSLITRGEVYLLGAANSKATIKLIGDTYHHKKYSLRLDHNGDGVYELIAASDIKEGVRSDFNTDGSPNPVITWNNPEHPGLQPGPGMHIYLDIERSINLDVDSRFDDLQFHWTLESRPETSKAGLRTRITSNSSIQFDKMGHYQISLKVTDPDGNTGLAIQDFYISDTPPVIEFLPLYEENPHIELGEPSKLIVFVRDNEDDWRIVQGYSYAWAIQGPEGSSSLLSNAGNHHATITPDKPGTYIISYQATDSAGNTTEVSINLEAKNTPPEARIVINTTYGNGGIPKNTTISFSGELSQDPNTSDHQLTYQWSIQASPSGSQAQINNYPVTIEHTDQTIITEKAEFTPDVVGNYQISLMVTDKFGLTDSTYHNFTVIDQ